MLLQLRDYLSQKQSANLQEIAWHFKQPPETVRLWLSHWERKGRVCRQGKPAGCGVRCKTCKPEYAEVYRWVV